MKIYAASDLHGKLDFSVPPCDLLLLGGDICPDFAPGTSFGSSKQEEWLDNKFRQWLSQQPAKDTLATFGNHDFVRVYEAPKWFHTDKMVEHTIRENIPCDCSPDPETGGSGCRALNIKKTPLKIWLSPWSNTFGGWAWMADPDTLANAYALIPEGVDIIVSHQPPYGYGDQVQEKYRMFNEDPEGHVGSKELLLTIDRVKPKAVICGHIHSGYGPYEYVRPDGGVTKVYNVSVVNEQYQRVNEPTEIIL